MGVKIQEHAPAPTIETVEQRLVDLKTGRVQRKGWDELISRWASLREKRG